jgi:putative transposase
MKEYQSLAHTRWDCKYHVVFIPKGRKKAIFGAVRKHLGGMLHELAQQKECKIVEGHLMPDHVHMCISSRPRNIVVTRMNPGFQGFSPSAKLSLIR